MGMQGQTTEGCAPYLHIPLWYAWGGVKTSFVLVLTVNNMF